MEALVPTICKLRAVLGRCYCRGRYLEWRYHTPTGCADSFPGLLDAREEYDHLDEETTRNL